MNKLAFVIPDSDCSVVNSLCPLQATWRGVSVHCHRGDKCALFADYSKATREQKLVNEIGAAKREKDFYLAQVDKAKAREAQQQRRLKVGS